MPPAWPDRDRDGSETGRTRWATAFSGGGGGKTKTIFSSMCELLSQPDRAEDQGEGLPGAESCAAQNSNPRLAASRLPVTSDCPGPLCVVSSTAMSRAVCQGYPRTARGMLGVDGEGCRYPVLLVFQLLTMKGSLLRRLICILA